MIHTPFMPRVLRRAGVAFVASLSLLLAGCFISPGKFSSELVLGDAETFSFSYDGEIFFLALSDMGPGAGGVSGETFEPSECYVDATSEVRECTRNEIAGQRAAWEQERQSEAAQAKQQAEQMAAIMGGIDPSDPQAAQKIAEMLMRQKGYESVISKGKGVFDVRYRIEGKLTHDFMFPVIEGFPTINPFVQILLRDGAVARINAPGYAAVNESRPMQAMFGGMGAMAGLSAMAEENGGGSQTPPAPPAPEGDFTIIAAPGMQIRANNTDEGASPTARGQELRWSIDAGTTDAPTALIALGS